MKKIWPWLWTVLVWVFYVFIAENVKPIIQMYASLRQFDDTYLSSYWISIVGTAIQWGVLIPIIVTFLLLRKQFIPNNENPKQQHQVIVR